MACRFEVTLASEDARHVEPPRSTRRSGRDRVRAHLVPRHSELSRVNREAAAGPVEVGPFLFALLALCRELHALTGGAFDPASTALSRAWGFLDRRPHVPDGRRDRRGARPLGNGQGRARRGEAQRALHDPGVESASARWARAGRSTAWRRRCVERGVRRALVSAGGSSQRAWGGEAFELTLEPQRQELGRLFLRDAALATSASGEQHFEVEGRRYGHVLDPRTAGRPRASLRERRGAATPRSPTRLLTAFLVAGPALAEPCAPSRPGTLALLGARGPARDVLPSARATARLRASPGVGLVPSASAA